MNQSAIKFSIIIILIGIISSCSKEKRTIAEKMPLLKVSENHHFLMDENGNPFFWLGDTGWLLF